MINYSNRYTLKDQQQRNRNLNKNIPIITPFVLALDPTNACNLKCNFCYMSSSVKKFKKLNMMNLENYKKIINDCTEFDKKIKVLRLYKNGEPLLNKNIANMIKIAKDSNNFEKIDLTTNGTFLNKKLIDDLIKSGLDKINISINGVDKKSYFRNVSVNIEYKDVLNNIKYFHKNKNKTKIYIKTIKQILTENEQKIFINDFKDFSDEIFMEELQDNWPEFKNPTNYLVPNKTNYGNSIIKKNVCPFIFYVMVINSDMTVSICIQDWKNKKIAGSLKINTLKEIWDGKYLNEMRYNHLKHGYKCDDFCSKCNVIHSGTLDEIVASDKIIKLYKDKI